jgi:hypothetical protein
MLSSNLQNVTLKIKVWSQNSSVGIAARYMLEDWRWISGKDKKLFFNPQRSDGL